MAASQNPPRNGEGDRAASRRGGGGFRPLQRPEVYEARKMRREMSLPEVLLWNQLRRNQLGVHFRKQHPIGSYQADFCCASLKLVIEVDGADHNCGDRPQRDERRDQFMMEQGYLVLRFLSSDVLKNMEQVVSTIKAQTDAPLHHPSDGPPPRKRGGSL